jgi:hypothetical protein
VDTPSRTGLALSRGIRATRFSLEKLMIRAKSKSCNDEVHWKVEVDSRSGRIDGVATISVWQGVVIYGLPKVSLGPVMLDPSIPCRRATPETALPPFQGWPARRVTRPGADFYPLDNLTLYAYGLYQV